MHVPSFLMLRQRSVPLVLFLAVSLALAGVIIVWFFNMYARSACATRYTYVNTDVVCGAPDVIGKGDYADLQNALTSYIAAQENAGSVQEVAVYFRDLDNGPTFGINASDTFAPASLLKLPLALTYFNLEEKNPGIVQKEIGYYGTSSPFVQNFPPKVSIEAGHLYRINDLLFNTLAYSDDKSYGVLTLYLQNNVPGGTGLLLQTYQDLGIIPLQTPLDQNITVRGYASIFRILYNASYLDPGPSETVLSWLAKSDFDLGLVAGVPQGTRVAHKFGELTRPDGTKQLHDCGIIYYPGNPYSLCIMTRGTDWATLENVIQTISNRVYTEVDTRRY